MQRPEGGSMAPVARNIEDACLSAQRVRVCCLKGFDSKRYTNDINRCFVQLNKALRGLTALKRLKPNCLNVQDDDCDIGEVLEHLDSIVFPNPTTFKEMLSKIPDFPEAVNNEDYFRMRRIRYTSEMTTFKPLFSLIELTLPSGVYAYCSLGTKVLLLLLELAQLDYWAYRFYNGLGYSRMALLISTFLMKGFEPLFDSFVVLHHLSCYVVLTALCLLKTEEHQECGCNSQMVEVAKSCSRVIDVFLQLGAPKTTDQKLDVTQYCNSQPRSLGGIFIDVSSVHNHYNKLNPTTCRQIGVLAFYMEFRKNDLVKGKHGVKNLEVLKKTVSGNCLDLAVTCFTHLDYPYLKAAVLYTTGCSCCVLSAELDGSDERRWEEHAIECLTECLNTLSDIPSKMIRDPHLTLYGYARAAITVTCLRSVVCTIHTLPPEEKVKRFNTLRDLRKESLPRDKLLGEQTKDKLVAAVSVIHIYLANHVHELMTFKNGKYRKKLRASLLDSRRTAESLLTCETNAYFCCFLISDLGEHWNVEDKKQMS